MFLCCFNEDIKYSIRNKTICICCTECNALTKTIFIGVFPTKFGEVLVFVNCADVQNTVSD